MRGAFIRDFFLFIKSYFEKVIAFAFWTFEWVSDFPSMLIFSITDIFTFDSEDCGNSSRRA